MPLMILSKNSLKTRISLAILLVFLAGLWSLSFFASQLLRNDMEKMLGDQQLSTVSFVASKVDSELESRINGLEITAQAITPAMIADPEALQLFLENRIVLHSLYSGGILALDLNGKVIADVPISTGRIGVDLMERDSIATALKEEKPKIGKPVVGKKLGSPIFHTSVPIRDAQGKVIGALSGVTDLGVPNFLDQITDNRFGKTGGYVLLNHKDRQIITATDKSRIMEILPPKGVIPTLDRFLDGWEGSAIYTTPRQVEVLGSAKAIPASDWLMGLTLPLDEAFAPIRYMQQRMLLITFILTLVAGGLTWWVLRRQLAPILTTASTLAAMANSDQPLQPLEISRQDEIGHLIGGFNHLLETIEAHQVALRESEERFRIISSISSDLLYSCQRSDAGMFRIDWVLGDATLLMGHSNDEVIAQGCWRHYVVEEDQPLFVRHIANLEPGQSSDTILRLQQPDGSVRYVHSVAQVKNDSRSSSRHKLYGALTDITELEQHRHHLEDLVASRTVELERAKDIAEAANLAKRSFLSNMSHEIRTPLNGIVGMAHILRRGGVTPQQADRLDKIDTSAQHLVALINDILDISKIEAGKLVLEKAPINIESLVANVRSILTERAQAKNIPLQVDVESVAGTLYGDPTRLQQALLNYASNALKFTEKGTITLRAMTQDETPESVVVRFEVEDTGIGIPTEALPRLFSAFEQEDKSTTRKYGGTGLGLAITRRLAEIMCGEVGVNSREGHGSTFWFTARLTRKDQPERRRPTLPVENAEQRIRKDHRGRRILLVDDEPTNLEIAKFFLEGSGLVVDIAEDGNQAIEKVRQTSYAIILMDMQMPNLDGLQATQQIRKYPEHSLTPILAMTANAFFEDKARCLAAGMNDFIVKPFDPETLCSVLLKWLENRHDYSNDRRARESPLDIGRTDFALDESGYRRHR